MNDSIKRFLAAKETKEFAADTDKFKDYPIQFVNEDELIENGYIQDVYSLQETCDGVTYYEIQLTILRENGTAFRFSKSCNYKGDCQIDWDTIHCANDIIL